MNSTIPQRSSLVAETLRVLREAIAAGRWQDELPGERRLCEEWHISRPTLRAALTALAAEGLVIISQGKPTRVCQPPEGAVASPPSQTLTVGLLSPEPLHGMPPFVLLWVDELRSQLASEGHLLQVHVGRAWSGGKNPARALQTLTTTVPASAWVLYRSTEAMQQWFEQKQIPCVVVGSVFKGLTLPSVDRDHRAVCRHAVGMMAARGHQRLALVIQEPQFAGDRESEAGFDEGIQAAAARGITGLIQRHDGSREGILKALDRLLSARQRPQALLIARTSSALTVCTGLLHRGIRIPQDMALICRDDDIFLDETIPQISRYSISAGIFAKRIFRLVRQPGVKGDTKVMPEFVKRESL
jgi:DNA-binding LacI/PurR family transcriptional regulator